MMPHGITGLERVQHWFKRSNDSFMHQILWLVLNTIHSAFQQWYRANSNIICGKRCVFVYVSVQLCMWVYNRVCECTTVYVSVQPCMWVYNCVCECTTVYVSVKSPHQTFPFHIRQPILRSKNNVSHFLHIWYLQYKVHFHYSLGITNKMSLFSIYLFNKALHVSGGTSNHHQELGLYIQLLVFVKPCCYLWWSWSLQVAASFDKYQKLYVQSELLMMGGVSTRNMYSIIEINKLRKVTSCWLYLRNISEDARTYECQLYFHCLQIIDVYYILRSCGPCLYLQSFIK
jgi:hypothetical protein